MNYIRWLYDTFYFINFKINELYLYPLQNFQKIHWFYKVTYSVVKNKNHALLQNILKSERICIINENSVNQCSIIGINVLF